MEISIHSEHGIVAARQEARAQALSIGFSPAEATLISTVVSGLARATFHGWAVGDKAVRIETMRHPRRGLRVNAVSYSPGMGCLQGTPEACNPWDGGLGARLPIMKKVMDAVDVWQVGGLITAVTVEKWLPREQPILAEGFTAISPSAKRRRVA